MNRLLEAHYHRVYVFLAKTDDNSGKYKRMSGGWMQVNHRGVSANGMTLWHPKHGKVIINHFDDPTGQTEGRSTIKHSHRVPGSRSPIETHIWQGKRSGLNAALKTHLTNIHNGNFDTKADPAMLSYNTKIPVKTKKDEITDSQRPTPPKSSVGAAISAGFTGNTGMSGFKSAISNVFKNEYFHRRLSSLHNSK